MNEPLFSPSASNWTGMSPAFGWIPPAIGARPGSIGTSGFGTLQSPQPGQAVTGTLAPVQASPTSYPTYSPMYAAVQPYAGTPGMVLGPQQGVILSPPLQEVPISVAAPAILAAVAIRRGQPMGPTSDQEIEEFIYDVLELLPGTNEVEVRCEGGRATLTGSVQHKRLKHDVGEVVWAIPHVADVQNNVTIAARRRSRPASREGETISAPVSRKQA